MRGIVTLYELKILEAIWSGAIQVGSATIQRITILHDDWCSLLQNGDECNCDPVIEGVHEE
jgi:hypothetical protein